LLHFPSITGNFVIVIRTPRLILRQWKKSDFAPFAKLNADPKVREFFPNILTTEESNQIADIFLKSIEEKGYGLWAVSVIGGSDFIGMIGINDVPFKASFTPAIEIGWRIAHEFWGHGYATEGAIASLKFGFEVLNLHEIVAFTTLHNMRSQKVMEKIGMKPDPKDDFIHPKLDPTHPLAHHVLYRITKNMWDSASQKDFFPVTYK